MNEDEILLAGDWHGDKLWGGNMIQLAGAMGIRNIFHVGDWGLWPGPHGREYVEAMEFACKNADVFLFVTPGNHEDWVSIDALEPAEDGLCWLTPHIALIPRGFRWEMNGRTFVSLGGAPSIDFYMRRQHIDWWPEEMITLDMAEAVAAAGHADVMITHDSPTKTTPAVRRIIHDPNAGNWWSPEGLAYAKAGRLILDVAVEGVQPDLLVHGHFHVGDAHQHPDGTSTVSLDQQRTKQNMAILNLNDLTFRFVDPWKEWGDRAPVARKVTQ